jgi:hypothetical protein
LDGGFFTTRGTENTEMRAAEWDRRFRFSVYVFVFFEATRKGVPEVGTPGGVAALVVAAIGGN